jgi:hypothetical protein
MTNYRIIGTMLFAMANWADDALAGRVAPPLWVAHQLISTSRYIASLARFADEGGKLDELPGGGFTLPDPP